MTSGRLASIVLVTGTVLPFLVGIVVWIVLSIAGQPVLSPSVILGLPHVWIMLAVAFALSSLPSYGLVLLFSPGGDVTPAARGATFGFVVAVLIIFRIFWSDAHDQIEGFTLAWPIATVLLAILLTVGAALGGALGFGLAWLRSRRDGDESE